MRKPILILLVAALLPATLFAQHRDRGRDGRHPYYRSGRSDTFDVTPFGGYRYGGTIYADRTNLFARDVDVASGGSYGAEVGIPLGWNGIKLELMANRQDTHFTSGSGLFSPDDRIADFHVTYYHGGLLIPFGDSRAVMPFMVVSAGVANLKPDVAGVSADNRFSASAGVGVKVPFSDNFGLRLEARGYYTSLGGEDTCSRCNYDTNRDLYQGETNLGIVFSF